jgi:hypothetical protein
MNKDGWISACVLAGMTVIAAAAAELPEQDTNATALRRISAGKVVPFYAKPQSDLLPSGYFGKDENCDAESLFVDTSGSAWFRIRRNGASVYSPASDWRYVAAAGEDVSTQRSEDDADRKRRLLILQQHRDWPRRIIKAVRDGTICLDMTTEQIIASWDEPFQKSRCFTLGLGNYEVWFFTGRDKKLLAVTLTNGRVTGWSLGEEK